MPAVTTILAGISSNKISVFIEFQKVYPAAVGNVHFLGPSRSHLFLCVHSKHTTPLAEWYLWGFCAAISAGFYSEDSRLSLHSTVFLLAERAAFFYFSAFASNSLSVYYVYKALLLIFHIFPSIHLVSRKRAHEAFQQLFRVLWCFCVPLWSSHIKNCVTHNNSSSGRSRRGRVEW